MSGTFYFSVNSVEIFDGANLSGWSRKVGPSYGSATLLKVQKFIWVLHVGMHTKKNLLQVHCKQRPSLILRRQQKVRAATCKKIRTVPADATNCWVQEARTKEKVLPYRV